MLKILAIIGWVVAVPLLALAWFLAPGPTQEQTEARELSRFEGNARAACTTFLRRNLHNPSSAEWVNDLDWPVSVADDAIYQVRMTYRAENAFGGTVTEQALCRVRRDGADAFAIRLE